MLGEFQICLTIKTGLSISGQNRFLYWGNQFSKDNSPEYDNSAGYVDSARRRGIAPQRGNGVNKAPRLFLG